MCGLAGYIGTNPMDDRTIDRCLGLMKRRGPDARGVFRHVLPDGRHLVLLNTRLAIIDLDQRADQPFRTEGRVLAYNGEIYNYLEIKARLEKQGEIFLTLSDTEVLIKTLIRCGMEGLNDLEGMWAFAFFDERDGSLILGRDRFGEKPLYIHENQDGFYFGSEPKLIFALLGHTLPVNHRHVLRYLVHGYKALYKTRERFFEGLDEFPAGQALCLDPRGDRRVHSFFPTFTEPDEDMTLGQAVAGARELLIESVRLRLRSDVPLAFCLSGGIDSNSLVAIAKKVCGHDVHGFTIVNTDERYSEQDMVNRAVADLNIRHTTVPISTRGFIPGMKALVRQHDAPVYTITYYTHWLLMEHIARAGYRISISGTGADELFSGYYDHHAFYLAAIQDQPDLFEIALGNWNRYIKPIVRNPVLQDPLVFVRDPDRRDHIVLDDALFASFLKNGFKEDFLETRYSKDLLRNRMLNELLAEAVPVILHEDDANAMYYSVENRSPFLDRRLYEFCGRIPTRHLIGDGFNKNILRKAMAGIVPDPILANRRKVGFNAPILDLLDPSDPDVRANLLDDGPIFDLVRKDCIETLLKGHDLPNSRSKFLFYFISAKIFLEEFGT